MSSFFPIISEILPMILPSSAQVTRAEQLRSQHPTVEGPVVQRPAIVGSCDKMCASVLTVRPLSSTPVRHNSEQDAIINAIAGRGTLIVKEGFEGKLRHHEMTPGDFAFIPAWTEHQVVNRTEADVVWTVVQSGSKPVGASLADWGGDEVE